MMYVELPPIQPLQIAPEIRNAFIYWHQKRQNRKPQEDDILNPAPLLINLLRPFLIQKINFYYESKFM